MSDDTSDLSVPRLNGTPSGFKSLYLNHNVAKASHRTFETQLNETDEKLSSGGDLIKAEFSLTGGLLSA